MLFGRNRIFSPEDISVTAGESWGLQCPVNCFRGKEKLELMKRERKTTRR